MSARSQLQAIFRRFKLSDKATKADLRKAYLKECKILHPDIAGPDTEERFKQINEEYERGMKLLKEAEMEAKRGGGMTGEHAGFTPGAGGVNPRMYKGYSHVKTDGRGGYYYTTSEAGSNQAYNPSWQDAHQELTPAQRLRNVLLYAGVIFGATLLFLKYQKDSADRREQFKQARIKEAEEMEQSGLAAKAAATAKRKDSEKRLVSEKPPGETVSNYYKSRSAKSSVRKVYKDDDDYKSPTEDLKTRRTKDEEGLGVTFKSIARIAKGERPSEELREKPE